MDIKFFIALILICLPSFSWLLLKQVHSPWWLENISSTPFIILIFYLFLMLVLSSFISFQQCLAYFIINFILLVCLNGMFSFNKKTCYEPINFFQFNMKYTEEERHLTELIDYLIAEQYHLITLQGVSQQSKQQIIERLSPFYPHFIRGESDHQQAHSDQLLFSHYAFKDIKYIKSGQSSFLITSQWQLPASEINLLSSHPPSPRNEKLWQTRNRTLYQLKNALNHPAENTSLVIGDLNLSKHSSRINILKQGMNTKFINSWPNTHYTTSLFGLAIDHLWVSNPAEVCNRQRVDKFNWSDHYAIKTQVGFK